MPLKTPPPNGERVTHFAAFLRALWGLEVMVQPLPALAEPSSPRARYREGGLFLPSAPSPQGPAPAPDYLLAAAAHAGAHLYFGPERLEVERLTPLHIALISLLEDARVERLASAAYPGLLRLWAPFHVARADDADTSASLLARLARALHDSTHADSNPWVTKGRQLFEAALVGRHARSQLRALGSLLANDLGQMRVQFNGKGYVVEPAYRDDNSGLWRSEESPNDQAEDSADSEGARRVDHGQRSPHVPPKQSPAAPLAAPVGTSSERERGPGAEPREALNRYPEWDYVIARERPGFCSVYDEAAPLGGPLRPFAPLIQYRSARRRLARAAARLGVEWPRRKRRLLDGDRLDWPRALAACVARAGAVPPDPRVYARVQFQPEPPSVLLLLDLSESLNARTEGSANSLLELARGASELLLTSLDRTVRDVAVFGFSSSGRHRVNSVQFKHFDEPYDAQVRSRLLGMRAHCSTRLGAALRHAARTLSVRPRGRRVLLVVSDGEPSDIDIHDPEYLLRDARQAIVSARQKGVLSFCIGLDPKAEPSVRRIFGVGHYVLLDRAERLPERLSEVYQRLASTRSRS